MEEFLVIPAIDIKSGKCVRLIQGDPARKTVELENPLEIALHWQEQGAKRLHLVDLDAAIHGVRRNEQIVEEIIKALDIPVQFGGGIRSLEDAEKFLNYGAAKVIFGTTAFASPEVVKSASRKFGKSSVMVALDAKNGKIAVKGWKESIEMAPLQAAKKFERYIEEALFTNIDIEGMGKGIDAQTTEALSNLVHATKIKIIYSGGVSKIEEIKKIKETGASGVVLGTALYLNKIDFRCANTLC